MTYSGTMKTVMITTFSRFDLTTNAKVARCALTVHRFHVGLPKVIVAKFCQSIILNAENANSVVLTFQVTIRHFVLLKFTMGTFIVISAIAEISIQSCGRCAAGFVVDAKFDSVRIT